MTRAKISEYSATANDNTDVNGTNIAEGCPPSSMNNMGREIMAALKRFQVGSDGDGVTVGGALVVSGATTIANTATLGNVDINGGTIDGTTIGGASAAAGTFTTLTASSPSVISVNSASNALRITQVGAGNALLVEDSANPDATPFVVNNDGKVLVGATAGLATTSTDNGNSASGVKVDVSGATVTTLALTGSGSTTVRFAPSVLFNRTRGTYTVPTVAVSSDYLGRLDFQGYDGTAWQDAALIHAAVDGTPDTNDMPGRLVFSTTADGASSPTERMRIDSSGNVGIGTTSPGAKLGVGGGAGNAKIKLSNTASGSGSGDGFDLDFTGTDIYITNRENGFMAFENNGAERMRITSGGDLLVGTTSNNFASSNHKMVIASDSSVANPFGINNLQSGTGSSNCVFFGRNGTFTGGITNTGTTTAFNTSSDYRLKESVVPLTDALQLVSQLNPVSWVWKADGSAGQGFIAHELQEIVPDCVTGEKDATDADGNPIYQGVDTSFLVATLTAAIQELKAELDTVKAELDTLKGQA